MGSTAIFTEVLEIGVVTNQFVAQLKQVEAAYAASIARMNAQGKTLNLGNTGGGGAGGGGRGLGQLGQSANNAAGYLDRFNTQLSRVAARLPATLLVATAMAAAFEAIKAPIDELGVGLDNLEGHSSKFRELTESLKDLNTHFTSVAAKPLFDLLVTYAEKLKTFLEENKDRVDQLVFAFGKLLAEDIKPLVELLKSTPGGLLQVVNVLVTALGYGAASIRLLINGVADLVELIVNLDPQQLAKKGPLQYFADLKDKIKDLKKDAADFGKDVTNISYASATVGQVIEGKIKQDIPVVPPRETEDLGEVKAQFGEKLSATKLYYEERLELIQRAIHAEQLSREDAAPKIHALLSQEQGAVEALIGTYKKKAAEVGLATGKTQAEIAKVLTTYDKVGIDLQRSSFKPAGRTADDAANTEQQAKLKEDIATTLTLDKNKSAALIANAKTVAAEIGASREELAWKERVSIDATYTDETNAIKARQAQISSTTEEYNQLKNKQALLDQKYSADEAASDHAILAGKLADTRAAQNYVIATQQAATAQKALQLNDPLNTKKEQITAEQTILDLQKQTLNQELIYAQIELARLGTLDKQGEAYKSQLLLIQKINQEVAQNSQDHRALQYSNTTLGRQENAEDNGKSINVGQSITEALHLDDAQRDYENANNSVEKFAAGLEGAAGVIGDLQQAISGFKKGFKEGGIAGGLGSILSNGPVSDALSAIPVVGSFIKPIGQILSVIGGLFTSAAKHIAETISKNIDNINQQFSLGNTSLEDTIKALQQQRTDAINQLSGKKGGKDQLDKILPGLDSEIAQLKKQASDLINSFEQNVKTLALGTKTLADWATTWQAINKQVKDYLDAGGSLKIANQYLNEQLALQRQTLQDNLADGDKSAIQDAIELNNLITQRLQLEKDEAATEFGIKNADSIERRVSSAVAIGSELQKQRQQYQQQLTDLNSQIDLDNQKVSLEGQIFDINKSIAALKADSNALEIQSLNEQLAKYKDMQSILAQTNGLQFGGQFDNNYLPGIPGSGTPAPTHITIHNYAPAAQSAMPTLARAIASEIRSGRTTFTLGQ